MLCSRYHVTQDVQDTDETLGVCGGVQGQVGVAVGRAEGVSTHVRMYKGGMCCVCTDDS